MDTSQTHFCFTKWCKKNVFSELQSKEISDFDLEHPVVGFVVAVVEQVINHLNADAPCLFSLFQQTQSE